MKLQQIIDIKINLYKIIENKEYENLICSSKVKIKILYWCKNLSNHVDEYNYNIELKQAMFEIN